jgi:hypothetical protein
MTVNYASALEIQTAVVAEVTPGTTPTTPTMLILPVTKVDLEPVQNTYKDASLYGDRMEHYAIPGLRKVSGSIEFNLTHSNFNPLFQTAFFNTFSSSVLKTGLVLNTLTIEEWHADISEGFVHTGCFADKLQIKCPVNGTISVTASMMAMGMATETSKFTGATYTAAVVESPMTHIGGTVTEGGTTLAYINDIDLQLNNAATALEVLGQQWPQGYVAGMSEVTGTLTAFFPSLVLLNKFINNTASSISFQGVDQAGATITFTLPNVIYTGVKKPYSGTGAVMLSLPFSALKDTTTATNIILTHS